MFYARHKSPILTTPQGTIWALYLHPRENHLKILHTNTPLWLWSHTQSKSPPSSAVQDDHTSHGSSEGSLPLYRCLFRLFRLFCLCWWWCWWLESYWWSAYWRKGGLKVCAVWRQCCLNDDCLCWVSDYCDQIDDQYESIVSMMLMISILEKGVCVRFEDNAASMMGVTFTMY